MKKRLGAKPEAADASTEDTVRADALSALLNLGYQRSAAEKAIDAALGEGGDITVESILRRSLQETGKGLKTTWLLSQYQRA